jgi:hypothetical protein
MQSPPSHELRQFHEFVGEKLNNGAANLSPEEVLDQWRELHPNQAELDESVSAIRQALADMTAGDSGRPVGEILAELRIRHNLPRK